ncbi:MAG: RNA-binding protein [Mucilaginibacter sp.]
MVKIFVGGFPPETNEMELVQLVSMHGQVETIKIVRDKISKKSKGYAFLEMKTKADADAILENVDGAIFRDKALSVKFAVAKDEGPAHLKFNKPMSRDHTSKIKRPRREI